MPERKQLGRISVITDCDTGMYSIGEIDGGFDSESVRNHIEKYGSSGLLEKLAYMTHVVVEQHRNINSGVMDNAIKEIIEERPEAYARGAENANKQPEESARQAVAENKKHAEFNRLFSRIGPKIKPEYRHQKVIITD